MTIYSLVHISHGVLANNIVTTKVKDIIKYLKEYFYVPLEQTNYSDAEIIDLVAHISHDINNDDITEDTDLHLTIKYFD